MINKKIMLSGISIVAALSLMAGATFAYFTNQANSSGNVLGAGTLTVSVVDQNQDTAFTSETLASNWAPGDQTIVDFDVKNTGTLPVKLYGNASGTWGVPTLDSQNMVKVTKVERFNGSSWVTILNAPGGITGNFYYTDDGLSTGTVFSVASGERAQLRLTVELSSTAGNDFQGQVFTTSIQVNASQANIPGW
jgi:predicted ribosomally synthesized peptide with SipW-like signal peptide